MEKQRTQEWFEKRKDRVTASVAGAILGTCPYMKREDVMRAMVRAHHGAPTEFEGNVATEWGTVNEPEAISCYEMETGEKVEETGFWPYDDWLGGSPDGLVDTNGLIEVKCPYSYRLHLDTSEYKSIPEHYYAQVQVCLFVTKRYWCDFIQWSPMGGIKIERVVINDKWLKDNLPKLRKFYEEFLLERANGEHLLDKAPPLGEDAEELVNEYLAIKESEDAYKKRKKIIIDKLRQMSGDKSATIGDHKLIRIARKGTVSYKAAVEELLPDADLSKFRGKGSVSWAIR